MSASPDPGHEQRWLARVGQAAARLSAAAPGTLPATIAAAAHALDPAHTQAVRLYVRSDAAPDLLLWGAGDAPEIGAAGPVAPAAVQNVGRAAQAQVVPAPAAGGQTTGLAQALVLPLAAADGVEGVLAVDLDPAPVGPERAAYDLLAALAGSALAAARLARAASHDATIDRLLEQISAEVRSTVNLNEILDRILGHLAGAIVFDGGSIALITPRHELEIVAAIGEIDAAAREVRLPVGQGIAGWVAATGQPHLSNNLDAEAAVRPAARDRGTNRLIRSYMAAPLLVDGTAIGILQVNSSRADAFRPADLALLAQVAARCATAVAQARLFQELQTRAERLAIVNRIVRRISASLELEELFQTCYDQLRRVMRVDAFFAAIYDEPAATLRYEFQVDTGESLPKSEAPFGPGLTSYVIRSQQMLAAGRREDWPPDVTPIPFGSAQLTQSLLIVPLVFHQRVLGALSTQSYDADAYNDQDQELFLIISRQTAVAIRNAELYQSERLAQRAKDEFLSLISHELKTPLTAIRGSAQLMTRRILRAYSAGQVADPALAQGLEQDARALQLIISQADRLGRLVDDLLDVSRLQTGRFELFPAQADLAQVARGVVDSLRATSPHHQLLLEAPPSLPGTFDPLRIEQVLTNLLGNAIKYAPPDTPIQVRVSQQGAEAVVCVVDQGPGLPPAEQEHIFERYFRAEAARRNPASGVGLGLYISRQLVEYHGGTIWVDSAPGSGASFCFRLPLQATGRDHTSDEQA